MTQSPNHSMMMQFVQQRLRLLQILRVKPFGEPNWGLGFRGWGLVIFDLCLLPFACCLPAQAGVRL
jgi:hypothetical protein